MNKRLKIYILPALSGLLLCLSFPNFLFNKFTWVTNLVAWFALVPLLFAIRGAKPKEAFRQGYLAGLVFFLGSTYWINYVKPMGWAAPAGWIVLCAYLALYPGLFCLLFRLGEGRKLPLPLLWMPALWTLLEYAREVLFTGFPWASLGSSQYLNPLVLPIASACGIYGIHFLVVLGNLAVFRVLSGRGFKRGEALQAGLAMVLLLVLGWKGNPLSRESVPPVKVAVIQGNIDQDQAWTDAYKAELMKTYLGLMQEATDQGARLLIWPEATLPGVFSGNVAEAKTLEDFAKARGVDLMVSGYDENMALGGYTNSSFFLSPESASKGVGTYAKRHLVPFGEFVPFRKWFTFIDKAVRRFGVEDLVPGPGPAVFDTAAGKVAPLICYEGIFASLSRQACKQGAEVLAIQTFDTWYGDSAAPYQHVALAVFRAVEQGRFLARAGATGVSCFISPQGVITRTVALNTRGFAVEEVQPLNTRTLYQVCGDWFVALCFLLCLAPLLTPRK